MKVTGETRSRLHVRRWRRSMLKDGFEPVNETGGKLWEIYRGKRVGQKIVDSEVDPDGLIVWVLIQ